MCADFSSLGLAVGHAADADGATGVTVVRGVSAPFRAAAAVLGRATGTRELDALSPHHLVDRVDAIILTGGSAYGLGAADGVMRWMEERSRGFAVSGGVVPIVPAAVIFDLAPLGAFHARPTAAMAYDACDRALGTPVAEGSVGVGTGATVGKGAGVERAMKGGVGCWVEHVGELAVGALVVVNALGDVRDARGQIVAGARADDGSFLDVERVFAAGGPARSSSRGGPGGGPGDGAMQNTTLAVVATNGLLTRVELAQLARAAGAALSRRITPAGTSFDGDVIFAMCPCEGTPVSPVQVETVAVHVLEAAIERAVTLARGRDGIPGLADGTRP